MSYVPNHSTCCSDSSKMFSLLLLRPHKRSCVKTFDAFSCVRYCCVLHLRTKSQAEATITDTALSSRSSWLRTAHVHELSYACFFHSRKPYCTRPLNRPRSCPTSNLWPHIPPADRVFQERCHIAYSLVEYASSGRVTWQQAARKRAWSEVVRDNSRIGTCALFELDEVH